MIKIKHFIIVLTILLIFYLLYRKIKILEYFDQDPRPSPSPNSVEMEVIDNLDLSKLSENEELGTVLVEFIYRKFPECSITRQFLHGCCQPIKNKNYTGDNKNPNENKILVSKESLYSNKDSSSFTDYQVNEIPNNPTGKYSQVKGSGSFSKVYKDTTYLEGNKCNPVDYYKDQICNLKTESTLYHLKKVLNHINHDYRDKIYKKISSVNDLKYFRSEQGLFVSLEEMINQNIIRGNDYPLQISTLNNLNKIYNFHLKLVLTEHSNKQEASYPVIRLHIPEKIEREKIEYQKIDYLHEINNIDQIMDFIYKNVVINVEEISKGSYRILRLSTRRL